MSPEVLRSATSIHPPDPTAMDLPGNFPDEAADAARDVTANASTVYDKALALQMWFQNNFEYDLSVQRGHGNNAIKNFLRIKRGYCEQFAGTFAVMARSLGIPARVAVGFTPGDLHSDGKYHVYGRNADASPRCRFDDIGWISFEPTPGRGEPGTESYTGIAPAQAPPPGDAARDDSCHHAGSCSNDHLARPARTEHHHRWHHQRHDNRPGGREERQLRRWGAQPMARRSRVARRRERGMGAAAAADHTVDACQASWAHPEGSDRAELDPSDELTRVARPRPEDRRDTDRARTSCRTNFGHRPTHAARPRRGGDGRDLR